MPKLSEILENIDLQELETKQQWAAENEESRKHADMLAQAELLRSIAEKDHLQIEIRDQLEILNEKISHPTKKPAPFGGGKPRDLLYDAIYKELCIHRDFIKARSDYYSRSGYRKIKSLNDAFRAAMKRRGWK